MSKKRIFSVSHPLPTPRRMGWGYGLGIGLIVFGLVILSVSLGQVLHTTTRGYRKIVLPGRHGLVLKAGLYLGLADPQQGPPPPMTLAGLNVRLEGPESIKIPVERTPGAAAVLLGKETVPAIFQFEVPKAGPYFLTGEYVSNVSGPLGLLLIHESLGNNRTDITVGVIVFLVLVSAGIYVLWAVRRITHPVVKEVRG